MGMQITSGEVGRLVIEQSKAHLVMEAYPSNDLGRHFLSSITGRRSSMQTLIKDINDVIDHSNPDKPRRLCEIDSITDFNKLQLQPRS